MRKFTFFQELFFKRILCLTLSSFIFLITIFSVNAYGNKIVTDSQTTKNNRLFEVPVGISSVEKMTAGTFTLSYDSSDIEFRGVSVLSSDSKIKAVDRKGKTVVVFVCADGVSLKNSPYLFTVKYKKISESDCDIKISVSDCVDSDVKNFSAPDSAVCKVKYSPSAKTSNSNYTRKGTNSTSSNNKNNSQYQSDDNIVGDDNYVDDDGQGLVSTIKTVTGGNSYPFVLACVIIAALFASSLISAVIIRHGKDKKSEENDKNK